MPVLEGPINNLLRALNQFLFLCSLKSCDCTLWTGFKANYLTSKLADDNHVQAVWELVLYQKYSRENEESDFLIDTIVPKIVLCLAHEQGIECIDLLISAVKYARKNDKDFPYMLWRSASQILNLVKSLLEDVPFELYNSSDDEDLLADSSDSDYSY